MKKGYITLLSISIALFLTMAEGFSAEKIIVIANSPWPPYYDESLETSGAVPELITAAYAGTGYRVKFLFRPWARVLAEVDKGKYDGAAAAYYRENRVKKYLFSDPYMISKTFFYKKKELPVTHWKTLKDLVPYRIGLMAGGAYSPEFDNAGFLQKIPVPTDIQNFMKLITGRIDLMVIDPIVAHYHINKSFPQHKGSLVPLSPALYEEPLYMIFSKNTGNPRQKLAAFNTGLKKIQKNGLLNQILKKYGMMPSRF